jgi:hypothetical protein
LESNRGRFEIRTCRAFISSILEFAIDSFVRGIHVIAAVITAQGATMIAEQTETTSTAALS